MTAQEHALERLRIALSTGRWEFVQEAFGILDGTVNGKSDRPRPFHVPPEVAHMLEKAKNARAA
jgi:hypothetical protein